MPLTHRPPRRTTNAAAVRAWTAVAVTALALMSASAAGQTTGDLTLQPWEPNALAQTRDRLLYQAQSHEQGRDNPNGNDYKSQLFWWDSYGRVRVDRQDPYALTFGYRYLTMALDTNSPRLPDSLDDVSLAAGLHLGTVACGRASAVLGAGYSSDNLFGDPSAWYGIGHLQWERSLGGGGGADGGTGVGTQDSLVLSLDYNSNAALLPDVPLPGFRYAHRRPGLAVAVGFPHASLHWEPLANVSVDVTWAAPYVGGVEVAYHVTPRFAAFAGYTHVLDAFDVDGEPAARRLFYEASQVEVGLRYRNDEIFWGLGIDADLVVGYAFDQEFHRGWDVRDLSPLTSLSDAPYVGLVLRGRF